MIVIEKWGGLVTNASPYAVPAGAAVTQVNLQILNPGQLRVRPGTVVVSWATHSGATAPIVEAVNFKKGTIESVVYQNASGTIYVAKVPS
jgi:hypothetical protein